jgi:hypothetical protein
MENHYVIEIIAYKGQKCEKCNGTGILPTNQFATILHTCPHCDAKGVLSAERIPIQDAIQILRDNNQSNFTLKNPK